MRKYEQGAVLFILLFSFTFVLAIFGIRKLPSRHAIALKKEQQTIEALTQAKQALQIWSLSRTGGGFNRDRPGSLPCPDPHPPKHSRSGIQSEKCNDPQSRIGRLPWRTLGIKPLTDGHGELLWYQVADPFQDSKGAIINSDTPGHFKVATDNGKHILTIKENLGIAIVFSSGPPLAEQSRKTETDQINLRNYLESLPLNSEGPNNRLNKSQMSSMQDYHLDGPTQNQKGYWINDRLIVLTQRDILGSVERYAGRQYLSLLQSYYREYGSLPPPMPYNEHACLFNRNEGNQAQRKPDQKECSEAALSQNTSICRGRPPNAYWIASRIASKTKDKSKKMTLLDWPLSISEENIKWLYRNRWHQVFYYGVKKNNLLASAPSQCPNTIVVEDHTGQDLCISRHNQLQREEAVYFARNEAYKPVYVYPEHRITSSQLSADDCLKSSDIAGVLIATGSTQGLQSRRDTKEKSDLKNYLEDPINQEHWTKLTADIDRYRIPSQASNDNLFILSFASEAPSQNKPKTKP